MGELFNRGKLGLLRAGVASPALRVGDVAFNVAELVRLLHSAAASGTALVVLPELAITGYSCGDLFYQSALLDAARGALPVIAAASAQCDLAVVVGLPLAIDGRLYNCAAFCAGGAVLGIVPKTYLPTTGEFYEERWFTSGAKAASRTIRIGNADVPFGSDLLFAADNMSDAVIGIEICEDLWAPKPPSSEQACAGATILCNPSASDELLSKAPYRAELVRTQSARTIADYLYAAAGPGESSSDLVYSGHSMIAENGTTLAETERFSFESRLAFADLDVARMSGERRRSSSFSASAVLPFRRIGFTLSRVETTPDAIVGRVISATPFVPSDPAVRAASCREVFTIASTGLAKRLRSTGSSRVIIGVSGGLDSTLALLATTRAFDRLGLDRKGIVAVSMPGPGTTARTRDNGESLASALGTTLLVVPIFEALAGNLKDIGLEPGVFNITYQNSQARLRTLILMNLGNKMGGFVVGTGDLSEIALGWCTFNGDHMSMYHVNCGIPKTLVRYLVDWSADEEFTGAESAILRDISATPISPELLPTAADGSLVQQTEQSIGPYRLHDFFLYYAIRFGFEPAKVFFLAAGAFAGEFAPHEILGWLRVFYARFFAAQFKRNASPDGPKVGSVALSPRGDWRMPADACADLWLSQCDQIEAELAGTI